MYPSILTMTENQFDFGGGVRDKRRGWRVQLKEESSMNHPKFISLCLGTVALSIALTGRAEDYRIHTFKKIVVTDRFWSEGADLADFNHDGKMDVASGPFWYEGPDFTKRHEIWPATATFKHKKSDGTEEVVPGFEGALGVNNAYSECFLTYVYDFNQDGWPDVIVYGYPGVECAWYENPK